MYVKEKILVGYKDSFHFERDLIIGAVYLSPERSTIYKEGKTGIDLLEENISQLLDKYNNTDLILGGILIREPVT